ncbi:toxin glutamine deamidase domain-containing protein [Nocardia terpenica]|uniref:Uncharacterized protein n=1 Tax=Nocardia terpenica TaxID=455432 RepID=A0A6G9YYS3_9NOCA|nr:toxin glutamine deamidase domain-containing protein [Nocardia terpenica]QIS18261.1 hypothetical protein F6W96_08190 [Nocardia terpenica]
MTLTRPPLIPDFLLDFVAGHWPHGDEDAMRRLAGHWSDMADALKKLQAPADQTMTAALSAIGGQTHTAMATYWQEVSGGGASDLNSLIAVCENFAKQLEHGATDIEHAKLTIYISIGTMVAMAFIPFGQIADLAAVAAVRLAIRRVVQQLIGKIMTKGATFLVEREGMQLAARWGARLGTQAAMGSALGAGTDVAAQGIQVAEHHREGGIDWGQVGASAESGAVAGAVGGTIGAGTSHVGGKLLGQEVMESNKLGGVAARWVSEMPGNVVGNTVAQTATSEDHRVDLGSVVEGAGGGLSRHHPSEAGPHIQTASLTDSTHLSNDRPDHSDVAPASAVDKQPPISSTHNTVDASISSQTTHPESSSPPGAATAAGSDGPAVASTVAAGHHDPAVPQPDSSGIGQSGDARSSSGAPAVTSSTGGPAPLDHAPAGQPSSAPATDRLAAHTAEIAPPQPITPSADRHAPASAVRSPTEAPPRVENAARPETPTASNDRGANLHRTNDIPQRATDPQRPPSGADTPDRAGAASPARETSSGPARLDTIGPQHTDTPHPTADRSPIPQRLDTTPHAPNDRPQHVETGTRAQTSTPPGDGSGNRAPRMRDVADHPSREIPGSDQSRLTGPGHDAASAHAPSHGQPPAARSDRGGSDLASAPHRTGREVDPRDARPPAPNRPAAPGPTLRVPDDTRHRRSDPATIPPAHRPDEFASAAMRAETPRPAEWPGDRILGSDTGSSPQRPTLPHESGSTPLQLDFGQQYSAERYAAEHGMTYDEVVRGLQGGRLEFTRYGIRKRSGFTTEQRDTPDIVDQHYLTEVVTHNLTNRAEPRQYTSAEPDKFRAGCHDDELPRHLTRAMPDNALRDAVEPVDPAKIVVTEVDESLSPMWRDLSENDEYLDARSALYRMDSRGPEIFGTGFEPRNASRLDIASHTGQAGHDGFVSLSKSPEHTITRDGTGLGRTYELERLPDGNFRQIRYMHELYHAHGIDVDATFHDATARSQAFEGSHHEAEILTPGGVSADQIYRIWPREIIVDAHGNPLSIRVGEPIYNPRFAHLDNPRFTATHDVPEHIRGGSADENHRHTDPAENDRRAAESRLLTDPATPESPTPAPYEPWLYRAPESDSPLPHEQRASPREPESRTPAPHAPWLPYRAPESQPPAPHTPTHEPSTPRLAPESHPLLTPHRVEQPHAPVPEHPRPQPYSMPPHAQESPNHAAWPSHHTSESMQPHPMPAPRRASEPPPTVAPTRAREVAPPHSNRVDPHQQIAPGPRPSQTNVPPAPPHIPPTPRSELRPPPPHQPVPERGHAIPPHERPATPPPPRERPHTPPPPRDQFREHGPRHRGDSPVAPHDPRQGRPHPVDARPAVHPQEMQRASAARQAREFYRSRPPEDRRVTSVRTERGPEGKPAYDFRRYPEAPGGPIAVAGVKVHVTFDRSVTPDQVGRVWERAQLATDLVFNHGQRLLSGDRVLVDLAHTSDPADANLHIHVSDTAGPWHPDSHLDAVADRLREQLGLSAEPGRHGAGLSPDEIRRISNDIAKSNTPAALDGLPETRVIGSGHLQHLERAEYQHAVEDALRDGNRFLVGADPRTHPYGRLINDGGIRRPGRNTNCVDNVLAALSCFHGRPQVALARWRDHVNAAGDLGESPARAAAWIGGSWRHYNDGRPIAAQYQALHERILRAGPGSSALVGQSWHARDDHGAPLYNPDGSPVLNGGHAVALVYPHGASGPVWWDPQAGTFSDHPPRSLTDRAAEMVYMTVDPERGHLGGARTGDQGASSALSGTDLRSHGGVPDDAVRARVGVPTEAHPGTDGHRSADRHGELRGGQADRGGHGPRESGSDHDRGDVRRSDPDGAAGTGVSDLPRAVEGAHPTHPRDLADDRVPRPHAEPDASPRTLRGLSAEDRQDHLRVSADSATGDERPVLGGIQEPPGRQLADRGDLRGVDPDHPEPARDIDGALTTSAPQMSLAGNEGFEVPHRHIAPADPPTQSTSGSHVQSSEGANRAHIAGADQTPWTPPPRPEIPIVNDPVSNAKAAEVRQQMNPTPEHHPDRSHIAPPDSTNNPPSREDKPVSQLHDHSKAPLTKDVKQVADLNDHPGGVVRDGNGLVVSVDGRAIQEHVDTMARDRAQAFRAAAENNRPRSGEKQQQAEKRVAAAKKNGTYVSRKTHGRVTAIVVDRRTGIAYEGVNGAGNDLIPEESLHQTLYDNLQQMKGAGPLAGGKYPAFDRRGDLENPPTRDYPHYDQPLGHAEVKAANEALWAREEINETRRANGEPEYLTGPEALRELYSQTYAPFDSGNPEPKPYCANCDHMMGGAENYSGRYTGFPHAGDNLVGQYQPQAREFPDVGKHAGEKMLSRIRDERIIPAREIEEQRSKLLRDLNENQREIVQHIVEFADISGTPDTLAALGRWHASEALDRARYAIEHGAPLGQISRDLAFAREHLLVAHQQELASRFVAAQELDLGHSAATVKGLLYLDVLERDRAIMVELDAAERQLIEKVNRHILESHGKQLEERARFVQDCVARAREMEKSLEQGGTPNLFEVQNNFEAVQREIQNQRVMEARILEGLGLDKEHHRLVLEALEAERARTLVKAADTFGNEVVRQAHNKAVESRELHQQEQAEALGQVLEQARQIEHTLGQGKEPDPEQARQAYEALQRAIRDEREMEARAIEPLQLGAEHAQAVGQALETERSQRYGQTLEIVEREHLRQQHNQLVGQSKALHLTPDQARNLDPQTYSLCIELTPSDYDPEKRAYIYERAGQPPVRVPYDSLERRYAEAARTIELGLSVEGAEANFLRSLGGAEAATEAGRVPPEATPQVLRARAELELERERDRLRQLGRTK